MKNTKRLLGESASGEIVEVELNENNTIQGFNSFDHITEDRSADGCEYLHLTSWTHKVVVGSVAYESDQILTELPNIPEELRELYHITSHIEGLFCSSCNMFHNPEQNYETSYIISSDGDIYCKECVSFEDVVSEINEPDQLFKINDLTNVKVPNSFEEVETLFCDSSGMGNSYERALTKDQAIERVSELLDEHGQLYGGITDIGQFQVYVTLWQRRPNMSFTNQTMKRPIFANAEELESIRLNPKDHAHFTNRCCLCRRSVPDESVKAIKIDRRAGFDLRQYTELDYACHECLHDLVGYFSSQLKGGSK